VVVDYLKDFASMFHSLWGTNIKLVNSTDESYSKAMAGFITCVHNVIENALTCLAIKPRQEMLKTTENE